MTIEDIGAEGESALRHSWHDLPEKHFPASQTGDGNYRIEKTCARCGLVKITVRPPHGNPWREWRMASGEAWVGEAMPVCKPAQNAKAVA